MHLPTFRQKLTRLALGGLLSFCAAAAQAELVVVVSAQSELQALSKDQAADIFLGKVSRLPNGQRAIPIDQAEGMAARDDFYELLTGRSPGQIKAYWSKIIFTGRGQPPRTAANASEAKKRVLETPNAITYIDRSQVDASVRVLMVLEPGGTGRDFY